MNLTPGDFSKIKEVRNNPKTFKVSLSGGDFYPKRVLSLNYAVNEVIVSKVASILGIVCPDYQIVVPTYEGRISDVQNDCYVISKDLEELGHFTTAKELGIDNASNRSLVQIWNVLEKKLGYNPKLMKDVVAIYLISLFFRFGDIHHSNWGIIDIKGEKRGCIIDNEYSFLTNVDPVMSPFFDSIEYREWKENTIVDPYKTTLMANLEYFLNISSEEFIQLFEAMYYLFTPEFLTQIMDRIEKEEVIITEKGNVPFVIPFKRMTLEDYNNNYQEITKVWLKYKEGRKHL